MATYWNLISEYHVLSGLINQEVLFLEKDLAGLVFLLIVL